jgi:threonine/homoserine/homoserine lactone efflux protein
MQEIKNGFLTGLTLQLAIGPVFFFITNLALQKSVLDGFAGVLAVTIVDCLYITLSILGIGRLLENAEFKKGFGIISSVILILFGILILKSVFDSSTVPSAISSESDILASFTSVFLITIFNPMTIVFFSGMFTAKAIEYNYSKKQLALFGFGTGFATFAFMGLSVIIFSSVRGLVPGDIMLILNGVVGVLLVGYGIQRFFTILTTKIP